MREGGDVSFWLFGLVQGFLWVLSLVIYISYHKYAKHPWGILAGQEMHN